MDFIDLKTQYKRVQGKIETLTQRVYDHGQFILGPEVSLLEQKLAEFVGARHGIACANGTDALTLSLMAAGVGPGDEVIIPAFTFFATVESPILVGATPVFVDIDPKTYLVTPELIEEAITPRTKAIIPVSLYGQCPDLEAIEKIALKKGIAVIEDAAQSFGATRLGKSSCAMNTYGATSFFPSKPLGCFGDGGMIFTSNDEAAEKLRQVRFHGQAARYHHVRIGLNSRLDTLQAAILLAKFEIFPEELQLRDQAARRYQEGLKGIVETPVLLPGNTSAWAQYTIQVENRDAFSEALKKKGIPTTVHYPTPLHLQPAIVDLGFKPRRPLPHSTQAAQKVISLPMHPYLKTEDQLLVIEAIRQTQAR